eukprot:CCRYP_020173-RA/>CCRYP_020173-RA protein AED:0.36 eAED:0.26 QI:0/0/0/1/0/0.5/2/0/299
MTESISNGGFLDILGTKMVQLSLSGFDHNFANCLMVWGIVGEAITDVSPQGTGVFYPDWDNHSGTCLEDGNEPDYMKNSRSVWLCSSLMDCCSRYFPGWNFNKCISPKGSGLWYVNHLEGKCVTDCEEGNGATCGGLANPTSDELYNDPKSCCQSQLPYLSAAYCEWIDVDLCVARSTKTGTKKYWPDRINGKCVDDTEMPTEDLSLSLFDSITECCTSPLGIFWQSEKACLSASGADVIAIEEVSNFYIDWVITKCVRDCEGPAPCGGFAQKWDVLYDSESDCCAAIPWIPVKQCVST